MVIKAEIKKRNKGETFFKAFADVVIDDAIVIHGIGIVEKKNGRHITMPRFQRTNKDGVAKQRDVCHPISSVARKQIEDAVFTAYDSLNKN